MNNENLIYGINSIIKLIQFNPTIIDKIYVLKINKKTLFVSNIANEQKINLIYVKHIKNNNLTYIRKYNAIICKLKKSLTETKSVDDFIKTDQNLKILILDRIQDPHNFAACIRTAEAFSINVIITNDKNCTKNSALINKISNGANLFTNIFINKNITDILKILIKNNIKIIGLSTKASDIINNATLTPPLAIVMGSEKNGLTKSIRNLCTNLYKIQLHKKSKSINVSVATGIVCSKIKI